jgi:hypothetical protein
MRLGAAPFSFPLLVRFGSASLPRTARYFRFVFGLGNSVYSFFSGCREMGLRCPPLSRQSGATRFCPALRGPFGGAHVPPGGFPFQDRIIGSPPSPVAIDK